MSDYSRGDYADLPAGTTDLENNYTAPDLTAIASNDNSTYANQTANNEIAIHQYKKTVTSQYTNILWSGKSSLAPSESPVILEVYNVTGTPAWEELDRDDSTAADTDFDLSYDNLATADYLDTGVITWRVYQAASVGPQNYTVTASTNTTLPNGRTLVKTSGGVLYCVYSNNDRVRVSKFTAGAWTSGVANDIESYPRGVAINSSDNIGILYTYGNAVYYVLFTTNDDQFGTPVEVSALTVLNQGWQWYDLVFDSSDKAHAVWADHPSGYAIYYSNNVSGWLGTPMTVASGTDLARFSSITIDQSGYPVIACQYYGPSGGLAAFRGDANNPTTFGSAKIVDVLAGGNAQSSVGVDSSGNIHLAYVADISGTIHLKIVKHLVADGWTTWQTPDDLGTLYDNPSIAIDGTDIYVFAQNTNTGDLMVFKNTGSGWDAGTAIQTGGIKAKARWSPYNNPSYASSGIEYTFEDGSANLIQSTVYI